MTARTGMSSLITELRAMTEAGTADYTLAGSTFWTDDQMQAVLDRYRTDVYYDEMTAIPTYTPTDTEYYTYRAHYMDLESGTALSVTDSTGGTAGTATYSLDAVRGVVTFTTDRVTEGTTVYYLSGRSYNLNAAAADIWSKKAGHVSATAFNWSTDNHSVSKGQVYEHCMERVAFFQRQGGNVAVSGDIDRSDTYVNA